MQKLKLSGIWEKFKSQDSEGDEQFYEVNDTVDGFYIQEPELLLTLWLTILNHLEQSLALTLAPKKKAASLAGLVRVPGYGLFST